MNAAGVVTDWNDVAISIFGWTRDEAKGCLLSELIIPPEYRDAHKQGLETFLRIGVGPVLKKRIEVTALRKDGAEFPVELSITPFQTNVEEVFLGFLRDITKRKETANRLERQALQARVLYETISFAAEATSFEAALHECMVAVQRLTGWPIGHVYLPSDTDTGLLVPSGIWHPADDRRFESLKRVTANSRFARGQGLPGRVLEANGPIWVRDIRSDDHFLRAQASSSLEITSALAFPIKNAGSIVAVVEFFTPVQTEPDPGLMTTLQSIGVQVGRVFERRLAEQRLEKQSEHQKLLLAELNHRVKNMLTVVTGIAAQTMRNSESMHDFSRSFLDRLNALSQAHTLLASKHWGATSLGSIVDQVLAPYQDASRRISTQGPPISLMPKAALAISLLLHELVTNAAKYGALSHPSGNIAVQWKVTDHEGFPLTLTWRESGVPNVTRPTRTGFGTRLISATVKNELRGRLDVRYESDGVLYHMDLQLPAT